MQPTQIAPARAAVAVRRPGRRGEPNRIRPEDRAAHDWYRFVLSFPPHMVRDYLARFRLGPGARVLDPFCGTGTTLVECKRAGIASVGIEANPMARFASAVKVDWSVDVEELGCDARLTAEVATAALEREGRVRRALPAEARALLVRGSISPRPLHKALALRDAIAARAAPAEAHHRLALARAVVESSNLRFGPEVSLGPRRADAPVVETWLDGIDAMARDLDQIRAGRGVESVVHEGDARDPRASVAPRSIDAVITSPPYPNEKDYTRATRLESVLLGFIDSRAGLRRLKQGLVRSNTRGVYKDDGDDAGLAEHPEVDRLARQIEARRLALGKTSGFERLYARVTRLYFGGMRRHLAALRPCLRRGARLAYVVGDQASYFRVLIRTGRLLAEIAERLGYEVTGVDLFRTRAATASGARLREEVVLLRWPGGDA